MTEFVQCLIILCVFFGFIFSVYISYKLKIKLYNSKVTDEISKEISVDMDLEKKE